MLKSFSCALPWLRAAMPPACQKLRAKVKILWLHREVVNLSNKYPPKSLIFTFYSFPSPHVEKLLSSITTCKKSPQPSSNFIIVLLNSNRIFNRNDTSNPD